MYRLGIIGTGIIVDSHIDALKKTNLFQVVAVCDIDKEKSEKKAKECNCAAYTDYQKIDTPLDAVLLNLPHFLHCEVTCYFLKRGVHVLVEKPMANTVAECDAMIAASEESGAKLAVGHLQRFFTPNMEIKKIYDAGTFGRLSMTVENNNTFYFPDSRPRWFLDKQKSGGGISRNYGAHALDKLMYIVDDDIVRFHSIFGNTENNFDVDGHAQFLLRFRNGVSSTINLCGYHGYYVNQTIYHFTEATFRTVSNWKMEIAKDGAFEEYPLSDTQSAFERQFIEFAKFIDGKPSNIATGEYSRRIIELLEQESE